MQDTRPRVRILWDTGEHNRMCQESDLETYAARGLLLVYVYYCWWDAQVVRLRNNGRRDEQLIAELWILIHHRTRPYRT